MSVIIYEGGKPRIMPETDTIYTDTVDGGICEWKPVSSMEIGPAKITENGEFTANDFNYYGLSEVEIDVHEEVGDYIVSVDEDGKPHIELDDWDLTIDDYGFPDLGDLDIGEALENLDFDTDIDISFDDMNLNIDTLDTDFELNLDTLELTETELPDEIRIMHVPNKTSYKDGEEIDLDGIIVQAYRGGEVWNDASGRYIDGYVPAHELTYSPHEAAQECKYYYDPRTGRTYTVYTQLSHDYFLKYDYIYHRQYSSQRYSLDFNSQAMYTAQNGIFIITSYRGTGYLIGKTPDAVCNVFCKKWGTNNCNSSRPEQSEDKNINYTFNVGRVNYLDQDTEQPYYFAQIYSNSLVGEYSSGDYSLPEESTYIEVNYAIRGDYYDYDVLPPDFDSQYNTSFLGRLLYGVTDGDMVRVSWPRPKDNKLLTASFYISVEESEGGE